MRGAERFERAFRRFAVSAEVRECHPPELRRAMPRDEVRRFAVRDVAARSECSRETTIASIGPKSAPRAAIRPFAVRQGIPPIRRHST